MLLDNLYPNYLQLAERYSENTKRKNYFLAACKMFLETEVNEEDPEFWTVMEELNENSPFGGLIGPDDSKIEKWFSWSKVIRKVENCHVIDER